MGVSIRNLFFISLILLITASLKIRAISEQKSEIQKAVLVSAASSLSAAEIAGASRW